MFKFDKKQEVFEIGGVKFGGQPGEYPTVLVSSMFYGKHKIVTDENKGTFDRATAESLWNSQQTMSDATGLPYANQIVGETPEAITNYIKWFVDIDDHTPFLIDSSAGNVRAAAAKYCTEIGVADRAVHNSINASIEQAEIDALTESDVTASIVLAFNAVDPTVKGKMDVLEVGGSGLTKGMLQIAKECGIKHPLIDVAAMPLGAGSGPTIRSIPTMKAKFGLPIGGGYHNMASSWSWFRKFKKRMPDPNAIYMPSDIGTNLVAQIAGSDYLLYGPIENVNQVFPAVAMVDIMLGETAKDLGIEIHDLANHPVTKLT